MKYMFYECSSLLSLPDLSKWNTSEVQDMSYLFFGCNSLKSFPAVLNWNTSNVQNTSYIFGELKPTQKSADFALLNREKNYIILELSYQPKEYNKGRVKIFGKQFIINSKDKCKLVYNNNELEIKEYFEDIDENYNHKDFIKFKVILNKNNIDLSYMFYECESLISLNVYLMKIIIKLMNRMTNLIHYLFIYKIQNLI